MLLSLEAAEHSAADAVSDVLRDALDALADHVALLGPQGDVIAVNQAWLDFAAANGYVDGGTGLGANYCTVCEQATGEGSVEAREAAWGIRDVLDGNEKSFEMEYPCHAPDEERWFQMVVRAVGRHGPVAAMVMHTNRTAVRLAARAEAESRARADEASRAERATDSRFRHFVESTMEGVVATDPDGLITYVNPRMAEMLVRDVSEIVGRPLLSFMPAAEAVSSRARSERRRRGLTDAAETRLQVADGTTTDVMFSSSPLFDDDGAFTGALAMVTDISERLRAAAAMTESLRERDKLVRSLERERAHLSDIFEHAPSFLAVRRGPDHVLERMNPAYAELTGNREMVGRPLTDGLPEARNQGLSVLLDHVRATGEPYRNERLPVQLQRVAGEPLETRYLDMSITRIVAADGERSVVTQGVDVTGQVLAAEALRHSEEQLRAQFASQPVPTLLWELRGEELVLLDWNESAAAAGPTNTQGAIGMTARELFPDAGPAIAEVRRSLVEGVVVRTVFEADLGRRSGRRIFELTAGPQPPDRILVHAVDITERAALESQLRQAQKMEAVGQLAGGVAHDFNNILTVIGAHSDFLLETLAVDDPAREDAMSIQKAGVRAAGLTRQLLAFSRKQMLKPTRLALNGLITETREMLVRLLGAHIEIHVALDDSLTDVVADATQIDQILVNLAVNARDAMPDGGVLRISTYNESVRESGHGAPLEVPAGDYVVLEVTDAGTGMDEATRARLFEPFFTTKEPGRGTGLGLATVYGIVKQSLGHIVVQSELGGGSTFRVYLPQAAPDASEVPAHQATSAAVRGVETVLVVEDEQTVREIAARVLRHHGYAALEAANGVEALALSAGFDGTIHLVISDAVMPGIGGAEVVQRLREHRPGLRALFMSGYTDDEVMRRGIVSSTVHFIQKPFAPGEFARAVREALDA